MTVFDANTFGPDEAPVEQAHGYSTDVLIDCDGERSHYEIGWYDHESKELILRDPLHILNTKTIRWSFLHLAIYETNPELRKTVKI
jgi:hypothetical protein